MKGVALLASAMLCATAPVSTTEPIEAPAIVDELLEIGMQICPELQQAGYDAWQTRLIELGYAFTPTSGEMVLLERPTRPGMIAVHVGPMVGFEPDGSEYTGPGCVVSFGGAGQFDKTVRALKEELVDRGFVDYTPPEAMQQNSRFMKRENGRFHTFGIFQMGNAINSHLPITANEPTAFLSIKS